MARQLTLIPAKNGWQLDRKTKETGRRGLAEARAALAAHRPDDQRSDDPTRRSAA